MFTHFSEDQLYNLKPILWCYGFQVFLNRKWNYFSKNSLAGNYEICCESIYFLMKLTNMSYELLQTSKVWRINKTSNFGKVQVNILTMDMYLIYCGYLFNHEPDGKIHYNSKYLKSKMKLLFKTFSSRQKMIRKKYNVDTCV